jgi:deoxycytidine triphosphate deaminase
MLTGYEFESAIVTRKWRAFRDEVQIFPHDMVIGTNSVDVTLSSYFRTVNISGKNGIMYIDPQDLDTMTCGEIIADELIVEPGHFILARIRERFETTEPLLVTGSNTPEKYVQMCHGRSTLGRLGIIIHCVAGFGDYSFPTHWTLEIANVGTAPVMLKAGMRIAQIAFEKADGSMGERVYTGAYRQIETFPGMPNIGKGRV